MGVSQGKRGRGVREIRDPQSRGRKFRGQLGAGGGSRQSILGQEAGGEGSSGRRMGPGDHLLGRIAVSGSL